MERQSHTYLMEKNYWNRKYRDFGEESDKIRDEIKQEQN